MKLLTCTECGANWGAVLDHPDDTEADAGTEILNAMGAAWAEQWQLDREPNWPATPPPMPAPEFRTDDVIWVSEADARWLTGNDLAEAVLESCWQPVADGDLPDWFVNARRTHPAVIVHNCCSTRFTHPLREHARAVTTALGSLLTAA